MVRSKEDITKEIEAARISLDNVKGTKTEVYTRITGYYRALHNWGKGKVEEYSQRKEFIVPASCGCE